MTELNRPVDSTQPAILVSAFQHLAHALRDRGGRYGLATLCVGVGQGVSVVIEAG